MNLNDTIFLILFLYAKILSIKPLYVFLLLTSIYMTILQKKHSFNVRKSCH